MDEETSSENDEVFLDQQPVKQNKPGRSSESPMKPLIDLLNTKSRDRTPHHLKLSYYRDTNEKCDQTSQQDLRFVRSDSVQQKLSLVLENEKRNGDNFLQKDVYENRTKTKIKMTNQMTSTQKQEYSIKKNNQMMKRSKSWDPYNKNFLN